MKPFHAVLLAFVAGLLPAALLGCAQEAAPGAAPVPRSSADTPEEAVAEAALARLLPQIEAHADSIYERLRPVAFLRTAEARGLRRYLNPQQLARARALGVRVDDQNALARYEADGRLVALDQETPYWVVADLDFSEPYVTPDARALLEEIGTRFQAALAERGLPPLRPVVASALRTPRSQSALRRENDNAARGTSTHEFGTTVDLSYAEFAAPEAAAFGGEADGDERRLVERVERLAVERAAARKSGELKAILGRVLLEMQEEGKVMVMLEERQPVFHLTVAERY